MENSKRGNKSFSKSNDFNKKSFSKPSFGSKPSSDNRYSPKRSSNPDQKNDFRKSDSRDGGFSAGRSFSKPAWKSNDEQPRFKKEFGDTKGPRSFNSKSENDRPSFRKDFNSDNREKRTFTNNRPEGDRPSFRKDFNADNDQPRGFYKDRRDFDKPQRTFKKFDNNQDQRPNDQNENTNADKFTRFDKRKTLDESGNFKKVNLTRRFSQFGGGENYDSQKPKRFDKESGEEINKKPSRNSKNNFTNPDTKKSITPDSFGNQFDRGTRVRRESKSKIDTPDYDFDTFEKNNKKQVDNEGKRLNRYIANSGICSRREADDLIISGAISINDKIVTELGSQVYEGDMVKYEGKIIRPEKLVYVLLNKPKDFLTTTDDPLDRKTVMHLVKNACNERIYPVGRLDRNTTGLLVLTNDGDFAEKISHPSNNISKIYQVELDKPITEAHAAEILEGVKMEEGIAKPDSMAVLTPDRLTLGIEIHIGWNRIVRRLFETKGYQVEKLDRTMYAGFDKKDLPRGNWRYLTDKEIVRLKYFKKK